MIMSIFGAKAQLLGIHSLYKIYWMGKWYVKIKDRIEGGFELTAAQKINIKWYDLLLTSLHLIIYKHVE